MAPVSSRQAWKPTMEARTVLAIDPGNVKCGLALVRREESGEIASIWRSICQTEALEDALDEARKIAPLSMVIVGAGTRSRAIVQRVREKMPGIGILVIDETETTLQARERYWEHNPRRGWRRLLPSTLQTPPQPIDDFVALILAERVLKA
jgi:RNase H-fold protein (predicted Holliday junction resolvase)